MKYTFEALNQYKENLLLEAENKGIQAEPTTIEGLEESLAFIEEKKVEFKSLFPTVPDYINIGNLIEDLLNDKDIYELDTGIYSKDIGDNDTISEKIVEIKKLKIFDLSIWDKTPEVKNNFLSCINDIKHFTLDRFLEFRKIYISSGNEYPLNGGSISAARKMLSNSEFKKDLPKGYQFIEMKINSSDTAEYRAYGAFHGLDVNNLPIMLYLSQVYTKNAGQGQANKLFDKALDRFNHNYKNVLDENKERGENKMSNISQKDFDAILKQFNYAIKDESNWEDVDTIHESTNSKLEMISMKEELDTKIAEDYEPKASIEMKKVSSDKVKELLHSLEINNKVVNGKIIKDAEYYSLLKNAIN